MQGAQDDIGFTEGLGILSKYPLQDISFKKLPIDFDSVDKNQRICLHATIATGADKLGIIDFFVSHLAFTPEPQLPQAVALWDFVDSFNETDPGEGGEGRRAQIVVADWNIYHGQEQVGLFPSVYTYTCCFLYQDFHLAFGVLSSVLSFLYACSQHVL